MSDGIRQDTIRNRVLKTMSEMDFEIIQPDLERVDLPVRRIIEEPGMPIEHIVFFESGVASRLVVGDDNEIVESSLVGFEGMTGKPVVLGGSKATTRIQVQIAGNGLAIQSGLLAQAMDESRTFRLLMTRYALSCELQAEYALLASTSHAILSRLARWLLMYHDRIDGDDFPITHDLLGNMLNVRRSSVTSSLHILEGEHAIRSLRGRVQISDRHVLKRIAGASYGPAEAFYDELIGPVQVPTMDSVP